jgi:hypothetical protein
MIKLILLLFLILLICFLFFYYLYISIESDNTCSNSAPSMVPVQIPPVIPTNTEPKTSTTQDPKSRFIMILKDVNNTTIQSKVAELKHNYGNRQFPLPQVIIVHLSNNDQGQMHQKVKDVFPNLDKETAHLSAANCYTSIFSNSVQTEDAEIFDSDGGGVQLKISSILGANSFHIEAFDILDTSKANFVFNQTNFFISYQFKQPMSIGSFYRLVTRFGYSTKIPVSHTMSNNFIIRSPNNSYHDVLGYTNDAVYYKLVMG